MAKTHILIIDDEKNLRIILKKCLEDKGYTADVASTGKAAIARIRSKKYGLVITDLRMPGISGQEAIKKMEKIDPHLKFIIISGYQLDPELERKIKDGLYTFFEKPFLNKDILDRVKELMKR